MKKGDIKYYKFLDTLGALRLCPVSASEISSIKDGAKILMSDINFEYGTHKNYSVELIGDIKGKDIKFGDYTFSYLLSVKTTYFRSYNSFNVYTSLAFLTPNGELVENNSVQIHGDPDNGSILYDIKLLMCLITVIGYSEDFYPMWNVIPFWQSEERIFV